MIALKCPSCAADLELDDGREFGFCQYCGTKIQLVQRVVHSGTIQVDRMQIGTQKLEAAKTLMELGEYEQAKTALNKLTAEFPQLGEAWLCLAKLQYAINLDPWDRSTNRSLYGILMRNTRFYMQSFSNKLLQQNVKLINPEQARDLLVKYLIGSKEMTYARKLLGTEDPLYRKTVSEFIARAEADCQKTLQMIKEIHENPMLLADYAESGTGDADAVFAWKEQLIYDVCTDYGDCYWNVSVQNGALEMELIMCAGSFPIHRYCSEYIVYADEQEIWTDRHHYIKNPVYVQQRAGQFKRTYKDRHRIGRCIMCGAEKGLFGCKAKCASKFK